MCKINFVVKLRQQTNNRTEPTLVLSSDLISTKTEHFTLLHIFCYLSYYTRHKMFLMIFFSAKYPTNKYLYCIFNIKKIEKLSENEVELVYAYAVFRKTYNHSVSPSFTIQCIFMISFGKEIRG